ncbi:hypothetical protein W97_07332 [Coniosporium apollinis CBS 100218]|uniref:Uncharacterized protein n=1 Tax=Coniosporium apollinis (strain CBS 100218) TaxID=1168221 RepID=R7Z267_CONA1|nr:uncharacterized protein W97_07332 [Coniosporium apollinis CBS 100218]EON68183.1 hypothetical protein W97_07332 [Coniosporium apollinis CBS 100218]
MTATFYAAVEVRPEEPETAPDRVNGDQPDPPPHASDEPSAGEPGMGVAAELSVGPEDPTTSDDPEEVEEEPLYVNWMFQGEKEFDYTLGPAKMVVATDGLKNCPAVLLNMELSAKLQLAIRGQRETQRTKLLIHQDREMLEVGEQRTFERLINALHDLEILSPPDYPAGSQTAASIHELKLKVNELKSEHIRVKEELNSLEEVLQSAYANQRMLQAEVNAILDDVLVNYKLLEPDQMRPDTDPELPPVQINTQQQPNGSIPPSIPSALSRPYFDPEHSELRLDLGDASYRKINENPQARARHVLFLKKIGLVNAQEKIDRYQDHHGTESNARQRAAMAGVQITSQTDLDLSNLKRGQELTRKLIEAEEAVRAANAKAKLAGVNDDQNSQSGKQMEGDEESLEIELMASADMASVERWLEKVTPDANPDMAPDNDADDWDFQVDDRPWDSVSTMA